MTQETLTRKLTAILYADIAGYSRLSGGDDEGLEPYLAGLRKCGLE